MIFENYKRESVEDLKKKMYIKIIVKICRIDERVWLGMIYESL